MLDESFRRWMAEKASAPARWMQRAGIAPNTVTATGFVVSVAGAWPIATGRPLLGIVLWLLGRLLDGYDGLLARLSGRTSLFGGFLDITLDMLAYSAVAVAFAIAMPGDRLLWMLVLVGYVMAITTTLALSSLLERAGRRVEGNRSLQFTTALAEGGETTIVYVILALVPAWSRPVLFVWLAVLALSAVSRAWLARRLLT